MSEDDERQGLENDDETAPLPSEQPTVDASTRAGVRQQERKVDRERREGEEFWRRTLADPVGRREIWRLLAGEGGAHVFEERFAVGPNGFPQTEATWFAAGEQAFGLRLYQHLMRIDRAGVFLMHDEHDQRFAKPKPRRKSRHDG